MALVASRFGARLRPVWLWNRAFAVSRYCDHVYSYSASNRCHRLSTEAIAGDMCVRHDYRSCSLYLLLLRNVSFSTGKYARLADGAVLVEVTNSKQAMGVAAYTWSCTFTCSIEW